MTDVTHINITFDNVTVVSIASDGKVVIDKNYGTDTAALVFWDAVEQYHPYKQEILDLRVRLSKYEDLAPKQPEDPIAAYERAMKLIGRP